MGNKNNVIKWFCEKIKTSNLCQCSIFFFCSIYSGYLVIVNCDIVHVLGVKLRVDRVMIGNILVATRSNRLNGYFIESKCIMFYSLPSFRQVSTIYNGYLKWLWYFICVYISKFGSFFILFITNKAKLKKSKHMYSNTSVYIRFCCQVSLYI